MSDIEVTLKRFVLVNGKWEEDTEFDVKSVTDKNGAYSFENLDTSAAGSATTILPSSISGSLVSALII